VGSTDGDVVHLVFRGGRTFRSNLFRLTVGLRDRCMSDPPLTLLRALVDFGSFKRVLFERHALVHGPRHATAPSGATAGGRIRSKSRLPGRSLLPSSTLAHVAALRSSRTFDRSARQFFRSDCATLLTLAPTFPTRSGPCDPAAQPGFLSWGCPKISPPSYSIEESASRSPVRRVAAPSVSPSR